MMAESKTKAKDEKAKTDTNEKSSEKKRTMEQKQDKVFNRKSPCMLNM